ncbi:phenylacetate--CoA ligase family protein [Christiangramia sp.]|uniref:phenylacetate--CoA ligase family protein n=1 Tax=Christiangramia sp. TaxID=1931228 RepID=UPI00261B5984|nr:AMP-binding protein [Christiangramia sp.]
MGDESFKNSAHLKAEQWRLFKKQLEYISQNSPYYKRIFKQYSISLEEINSPDDLYKIPVTTKEELQQFNKDFIAVPEDDIIDFVTTSGTLGNPVNFALNEADLNRLAENEYQSFKLAGVKKSDKVQITTTLDRRFMAGLAYFLGLRKLGAGIIRTGSGLPQLQWESIQRFQPNYLVAVPSFLLKMIQYAEDHHIDYENSSIKAAICIGEPLRDQDFQLNSLGRKIKELWDIELFSTYASTEMATAFTECPEHKGNHVQENLIYTEILDENGKNVQPGETGELVVTPLGSQTMPLLRFATGDILSYHDSTCKCGRNTRRLSPVIGRKQQKIKLKGTSLYPQHIIEVLNSYGRIHSFLIEARLDEVGNDQVQVIVPDSFKDTDELKDYFRSQLNVAPEIKTIKSEEITQLKFTKGSRKPVVFRDFRY